MGKSPSDLPVKPFKDAGAFEKWLEKNSSAAGLWLKIAKKDSGVASVTYAEALDVALCHGWIDGQKLGFDERFFLQRFTPRRKRSLWSKNNITHVERLIKAGRMRDGGFRGVEAAKADGRWNAAYHSASKMQVPPELAAAITRAEKLVAMLARGEKIHN